MTMASRLGSGAAIERHSRLAAFVSSGARRRSLVRLHLRVSATIIPRFFFEPPKPYPYKLGRRAEEPPRRQKPPTRLPSPPKTPNPATSKVLVGMIEGGLPKVVERAKHLAGKGSWNAAIEMASLAVAVSPQDAEVVRVRDEIVHAASLHGMMQSWRKAISTAAFDESFAERATTEAKWVKVKPKDRKCNTSKPRQGWTKSQMRLYTVRMCVCCRGLFPREDLWRITQARAPAPPPAAADAEQPPPPRAPREASGADASTSDASHAISRQQKRQQQKQPQQQVAEAAAGEKRPKRPTPRDDKKAGPRAGVRLVIESQEWGPHAEAGDGDGGVWAPFGVRLRHRSAYVCRTTACVSYAISRKAIARGGLAALVSKELTQALAAATAECEPREKEEEAKDREAIEALFARFSSLLPAATAALACAETGVKEEQEEQEEGHGGGGGGEQVLAGGGADAGEARELAPAAVLAAAPAVASPEQHPQPQPPLQGFSLRDAVEEVSSEVAAGPHPRGGPRDWEVRKAHSRAAVCGPEAKGPTRRAAVLRKALESILGAAPEAEGPIRELIAGEVGRVRRVPGLTEEWALRKAEMRVVLRLLRPALSVLPVSELRGPHDRWEGLPEGPR